MRFQQSKSNEKGFVLVFDLPRELSTEKVRINRELKRVGARMIQFSVWELDNLKTLIKIAQQIKKVGGKAVILEERFLFG